MKKPKTAKDAFKWMILNTLEVSDVIVCPFEFGLESKYDGNCDVTLCRKCWLKAIRGLK